MHPPRRIPQPVLAALLVVGLTRSALAADPTPPKTSLVNLVDEGNRWLLAAAAGPAAASDPTTRSGADGPTAERPTGPARAPGAEQQSFLDFSPNASIVARDWRGSVKIIGARTMLVDDLRPTASNRMVVGRLATDARLSLFGQVGAGEWRVDTVMFPSAVSYSEIAGQVGAGFELRLAPRIRVAGEVQYTMLYRDLHYTSGEVAPRISSCVLAMAGSF